MELILRDGERHFTVRHLIPGWVALMCCVPNFCFSVRSTLDEDSDIVEQPNKDDLNDSFLDDEEEEYEPTDEDSDWEPGKEDQEKEDMKELLKEAKQFMKRKK